MEEILYILNRKLKTSIFFFAISIFFFSGCKDAGELETIIEGLFHTAGIDEAVSGGPYKITLYSFNNHEEVDVTYTNSEGRFFFKHIQEDAPHYRLDHAAFYLHAEGEFPDGYWDFVNPEGHSRHMDGLIIAGHKGEVKLRLFKRAWIKIHLVNTDFQPDDFIRIQFQNAVKHIINGSVDTILLYQGSAHITSRITYYLWQNGDGTQAIFKDVVLPDLDTLYYKLEY
ncbi:MAG: hypothetical protein JJU02_01990 [Cryomorphaceae bacterium]|nr:hypothetical protein [Cryomorphaceae bacterium]